MIISIIIPVYNTKEYLSDCLCSIEKQDSDNYEIILVDDGSTDGSEIFCDEYQKRHENVTVIHQKNCGAPDARNAGLAVAKGEYIHFIDSDDIINCDNIYSDFIKNIYPYKPDVVFSRCVTYSKDLSKVLQIQPVYETDGFFSGDILLNVLEKKYQLTLTSPVNKLFRRDLLISNALYFLSGINHEEDEWLPRVIQCANTAFFYNKLMYGARNGRAGALSEIPNENVMTDKAVSKVIIASTGIQYMKSKEIPPHTLSLIAEYYWDYLTDACVVCEKLKQRENKTLILEELKKHKEFFNSCKYLTSRNRRVLGLMFKTLGINITVKLIGIRYEKQS